MKKAGIATIQFLYAFLMWLLVFSASASATSLTVRPNRGPGMGDADDDVSALPHHDRADKPRTYGDPLERGGRDPGGFGRFRPLISLNLLANRVSRGSSPPTPAFLPRGIEKIPLLLILAPLSEETLNRALTEGYLLSYGHLWGAITFSALLFALPHWMAFEGKGEKTSSVTAAFLLGLLAGYLYALGGILPAFLPHSLANLTGMVVEKKGTNA